jgi:hypothetical protein
MKRSTLFLVLMIMLTIGTLSVEVPVVDVVDVAIKDILNYPQDFTGTKVRVIGKVSLDELDQVSGYYSLKDDSGNKIKIRSSINAEPNQIYLVIGTVITNEQKKPEISEFQRDLMTEKNQTPIDMYILIGLSVVFAIVMVLLGYKILKLLKRENMRTLDTSSQKKQTTNDLQHPAIIDGKMIRFIRPEDTTLKLLAGRFLTIKGDDIVTDFFSLQLRRKLNIPLVERIREYTRRSN